MLFKVLLIGKIRDKLVAERIEEYRRRLGAYGKLEVVSLPDGTVESEGRAICRELDRDRNAEIYVLSEEGAEFTSRHLGKTFASLDRKAVFVIGGPFGLAPQVKERATVLWSLSRLTFPHEIAALLLFEQLYRAENLAHGGGYHH
ncbi:MAG: 23S rRNA (pseudouridine(1915)-N(3))-methyltransferase RlmH [Victivallaceae bacterium]|nr:23S rRNA (pseudouridine(1915)-N(3))-methyltransferase RlmH [Victivallaceae bacterium]